MKRHNAEDEDERQDQHDDGVDLEAGRLVGVETEHCAAGTTGAGGARAVRAGIGDLLLLVGGGTSADGSPGTSRGSRRGRASSRRTGRGGGVWGGGTRRRLSGKQVSHGYRGRMGLIQPSSCRLDRARGAAMASRVQAATPISHTYHLGGYQKWLED